MAGTLTLGELLQTRGRELRLTSGESSARERPVRGVHSTEMDHPALWVERDWVVLTSGLGLRRRPDKQRDLIAELEEAGVTALGFGIGSAFSAAPQALVTEARRREFPVFVVPWDVSFRDMIRDVYEGLLSDDVRGYLRLASMQHHLLEALADEAPQDTVIERLSSLVGATVAVIGPGGRVVRATGDLPAALFWDQLSDRTPMLAEFDSNGWHGVGVPLPETTISATRWLVVGIKAPHFSSPLTKRVAQITAPLLSAMDRIDAAARGQETQIKAALLDSLMKATEADDEQMLMGRAQAFGIRLEGGSRMLTFMPNCHEDEELFEAIGTVVDELGTPSLLNHRDGVVLALLEPLIGGSWDEHLQTLSSRLTGCWIGVGRPICGVAAVRSSSVDSRTAARRARALGKGSTLSYEHLDLDAWLVGEVPAERWKAKAEELVEPLQDHPHLQETVVTYFANELDVGATAAILHLHPNSLRYRLRRVEELLGRSLRQPSTIAALQLALLSLGEEFGASAPSSLEQG